MHEYSIAGLNTQTSYEEIIHKLIVHGYIYRAGFAKGGMNITEVGKNRGKVGFGRSLKTR